jgi:hypothetical protein
MNVNNFNSKLNLPHFLESIGKTGYQYVKLPNFGWYAYNADLTDIRNCFDNLFDDISNEVEVTGFISDLIKNKKQLFDFHITWSETMVLRIYHHLQLIEKLKQFHVASKAELIEGQAYLNGKYINLGKQLKDRGLEAFIDSGIGLVTDRILSTFSRYIGFPAGIKNHLILPSYCTPNHVASYEILGIKDSVNKRMSLYTNGEKGWYGNFQNTLIVSDLQKLVTTPGLTWDYKLDYWANRQLILDPALSVSDCVSIWTQARKAQFNTSPLDIIEQSGAVDTLKNYLKELNITQLTELEQRFQIKLFESWKAQKSEEVDIGNLRFIKKDNQYWILTKKGKLDEFTNFAVDITRIFKREDKFYRSGTLFFGRQEIPFELPNETFMQPKVFISAIHNICLNSGVGLPLVLTNYVSYLMDVINRLNRNAPIG